MSLENKVAIVTGSDSGIGRAIALELARQGAAVTINFHKNEDAADARQGEIEAAGGKAQRRPGAMSRGRRHPEAGRRDRGGVRAARHPGQQRRDGDPHLDPRHDRAPVRHGHRDRPQERLLRRPAGGQADDRAGRRRPDHQHQLDPRGLADAGQRAVLPGQGRRPDADPDRRRGARARTASRSSASRRARSTRRSTRSRCPTRPRRPSSRARSRSAASPSQRRSRTSWRSSPRTRPRTARPRRTSPTAA